MREPVRYTRSAGAHLAYRVFGDGPIDLLHLSQIFVSFDAYDDEPHVARFERRLGHFARVIEYDARGIGLSDSGEGAEVSLELAVDDAIAVLDAVGSTKVALLAPAGGGLLGIELANRKPERVHSLVLFNAYARLTVAPDYPFGVPEELIAGFLEDNTDPDVVWTTGGNDDVSLLAPSLQHDPRFREWLARASQRAAGPAAARRLLRLTTGTDVRPLLGELNVPTLVLARDKDRFVGARHSRYLAEHIPGARLVVLPGADHLAFAGDADAVLDEIEEFVTGRRSGSADRVLATLVFTDIVDSTRRAAELGDVAWRGELDIHDALVRAQLTRFGGREVNTTGDGFVATFDTPTNAIACARQIAAAAAAAGVPVRLGIHTGECERRGDDVAGLAVHIAARVAATAGPSEVVVSRTVCDLVTGSNLGFASRGEHELKGVPGTWELFAVEP